MRSVEIEKAPKLMPACAIKIANDTKTYTRTNPVKKTRESILESSSINHPLDCPICDQGGECDLQDQAMIYGSDRGRSYEYKRSLEDKNKGPLIKTTMTRRTHCTRCIRSATETAGVEMLGTTGRGKSMEAGSYIPSLSNPELPGNAIDPCPAGALTSKPYASTVRPWESKSIESIDVLDSIGSNIRIDTRGSELMRILPRLNDNINQQ
jgi:NADH dehydrogenase/NADH:ubiquinone oxidoreductase subunit G